MSIENDRTVILTEFTTQWGSRTAIRTTNYPASGTPTKDTEWVSIDVLPAEEFNNEWSSPNRWHVRRPGIIAIGIYVPRGTGELAAKQHADYAAGIFRGKVLDSTLYCHGVQSLVENASETWYGMTLIIDFTRDEQFAIA